MKASPLPAAAVFLALRYLLSRWVNVLGMLGVAVAVWALILVPAVFSGFIAEIRDHARGATADLVLTGVNEDQSYEDVAKVLAADPDVAATAPRLQHYAILFPNGPLHTPGAATNPVDPNPARFNFVQLIGVDPELERAATQFTAWLDLKPLPNERHPEWARPQDSRVEDPEHPFAVSADRISWGHSLRGAAIAPADLVAQSEGIVLPWRRFRNLGLEPGQFVDLVSARFERTETTEEVKKIRAILAIAGGFETRHRLFDETNAFVHIETLRGMLGHDPRLPGSKDVVTEVAIKARPGADLDALAARLGAATRELAGPASVVRTWEQQNAVFLGAVNQERALMRFVLFAVMLVAAFLIYATLHMMVTQKTKDIGILCAIGASPRSIAVLFTLCGAIVGTVGCGLGLGLGALSAIYLNDVNEFARAHWGFELFPTSLYQLPAIPYRLEPQWLAIVLASALLLALLVAYLPARRAARLDPVQTLNYE